MRTFTFDESQLPLSGALHVVGRTGKVATNDQRLFEALGGIYGGVPQDQGAFSLEIFVNQASSVADGPAYFRGIHHLVFAQFGPSNLFVFDIANRRIRAAITSSLAHNSTFWRERLLPILVGVFGANIGVLPLHAACLSVDGRGVLIAGASGAGKSNLSLALALNGAHFVSDDWTYVTLEDEGLRAHGLLSPVKLLPDAVKFFPALEGQELRISLNGELAYELPPQKLALKVKSQCDPDCLVFYERMRAGEPCLTRLSGERSRAYILSSIEPLPVQLSSLAEQRERIMSRISELPCWLFRHSGDPESAAHTLHAFFVPQEVRMHI